MSSILTTVTDAERKVVDAVRNLQEPVVGYVRKGVALADDRLPEIRYPASLPKPSDVIDSQADFFKKLIDAERDLVKAIVDAVAPLAGRGTADKAEPEPKTRAAAKAKPSSSS
jgi:hypothetical protein